MAICAAGAAEDRSAESPPAAAPIPPAWSVRGYSEIAYTWNTNAPDGVPPSHRPGKENAFRVFDVTHNEFTLHSVLLEVEKAATEASWVGFRAVAIAGQDARWVHEAGLFDGGTGGVSGDGSDFDLLDAYLSIRVPEKVLRFPTLLRAGKWETHHGFEVYQAPQNPHHSHSYLFGFAIPISHTGVIADTTWVERPGGAGEMLGTGLGISNGWDDLKDTNDSKSLMAQLRFQPCDPFETHLEAMFGPEQDGNDSNWRGLVDVNATVNGWGFLESLSVSGNYDYGWESDVDFPRPGAGVFHAGYSTWYGFAGYAKYRFRWGLFDRWYIAFRGEWFNDPDGARTGVFLPAAVEPGVDLVELTTTLGYRPLENVLIRLEHRFDRASEDVFDAEGGDLKDRQSTFAIDLVVSY